MEKNFYDLELIKILEEHIEDGDFQIISSDIFFDDYETLVPFIRDIATKVGIKPDEKVVYLGDNVSNLTYIFSFKYLDKVIVDILDNIPEHHYFLSERMKWILYISYEDCAEFALI